MNQIKLIYQRSYKVVLVLVIAMLGMSTITTDDNNYFEISKNIEIFTNLYKEINTFYVDDIDPAKLMRTGIDAMLESLDPYTNYISEAEMEGFRISTTGKYGGIGALISKRGDYVMITEPYQGFAAYNAGLRAGDLILAINDKSAKGKTTDAISEILKGSPGTAVELTIRRPKANGSTKDLDLKIKRERIIVPNVPYSGVVDGDIGYIVLTTFTEKAGFNVEKALKDLQAKHELKGVILDLRGNGGGLLSEAINVSNVFIPRGKSAVTTRGKIKDWDRDFKTRNKPVDLDIPLAVLIDGSSASASEIVSGVIQDFDRGVLVGQKSYGKGLVQNTRDVGYNSRVKLTTAKYYIPSGRCIQAVSYKNGEPVVIPDSLRTHFETLNGRKVYDGGGIIPDVKVEYEKFSNIAISLIRKNLIFEYASKYAFEHESIAEAKLFKFTDTDFANFEQFLQDKDYSYETSSEKILKDLEEKAKKEKYYDAVSGELDLVKKRIQADKKNDIRKFKGQIVDMLEREIIARYHFQKGKFEVGLKNDAEIKDAVKALKDATAYNKLLGKK